MFAVRTRVAFKASSAQRRVSSQSLIFCITVGPVCWENCPAGWVDEGALCREEGHIKTIAKKSYGTSKAPSAGTFGYKSYLLPSYTGRGVGKVLECPLDKEYDAGLCYTPCKPGYYGGDSTSRCCTLNHTHLDTHLAQLGLYVGSTALRRAP